MESGVSKKKAEGFKSFRKKKTSKTNRTFLFPSQGTLPGKEKGTSLRKCFQSLSKASEKAGKIEERSGTSQGMLLYSSDDGRLLKGV